MTKVTIGLPVFNGAAYLPQAIESILSQSLGDFELVISDNASQDATEEICRKFVRNDRRIRYSRQTRNVGAAGNHNLLFTHGDSPYFKWASHDDVLHPRFLEMTVAALDARPEVVLASPASAFIDELGQPLRFSPDRRGMVDRSNVCWPCLPEDNPGLTASDPATRFTAVMLKTVMCVEVYGLMRRSAMSRTSLLGHFSASDKVLLAQMALLGPFWLGPEVLFYRRCHAEQFSARSSGSYRAIWYSGRQDSLLAQQLKLLSAYWRSANMYQLGIANRSRCFLAIARRALSRGHHLRRLTSGLVGNP
jgi:glycosyltransferase involved in cell wall biosynthesis